MNNEGIGLGLNIVKQIVKSYAGSVKVSSPGPGLGSTFRVSIPMEPADVLPRQDPTPPNENRPDQIINQLIED